MLAGVETLFKRKACFFARWLRGLSTFATPGPSHEADDSLTEATRQSMSLGLALCLSEKHCADCADKACAWFLKQIWHGEPGTEAPKLAVEIPWADERAKRPQPRGREPPQSNARAPHWAPRRVRAAERNDALVVETWGARAGTSLRQSLKSTAGPPPPLQKEPRIGGRVAACQW